jgi:Fe-S-cluster containining protein
VRVSDGSFAGRPDRGRLDRREDRREKDRRGSAEREEFLRYFSSEVPETLFSQIAAQALFHCENCGECCQGEGYALVDEMDIAEIARALTLRTLEVKSRFTEPDPGENAGCRILKSSGPVNCCCFFDTVAMRCRIYCNRPRICRTFPMLNADPLCDEPISFYSDCLGTAHFVRMIAEKRKSPQVQKDIDDLMEQPEKLLSLRVSLYVWLCRLLGKGKEADQICRIMGDSPLQDDATFSKDCLAYFLMTIRTDGLEEYEYEG